MAGEGSTRPVGGLGWAVECRVSLGLLVLRQGDQECRLRDAGLGDRSPDDAVQDRRGRFAKLVDLRAEHRLVSSAGTVVLVVEAVEVRDPILHRGGEGGRIGGPQPGPQVGEVIPEPHQRLGDFDELPALQFLARRRRTEEGGGERLHRALLQSGLRFGVFEPVRNREELALRQLVEQHLQVQAQRVRHIDRRAPVGDRQETIQRPRRAERFVGGAVEPHGHALRRDLGHLLHLGQVGEELHADVRGQLFLQRFVPRGHRRERSDQEDFSGLEVIDRDRPSER